MTTVRKTITVTETQDAWITAQVQAGRFTNDSELIRDLIRREQERITQAEALRQALIEGERSGAPQAFDFAAFTRRKVAQAVTRGRTMGKLIRIASIPLLAGALLAPAQTGPNPPSEARGFSIEQVGEVELAGIPGLEGYKLRMRRITAAPGGAAPEHSHQGRPAMIYVLQGRFTDHRNGITREYGVGPGWPEDNATTHWVENRGREPAVQLSVDLVKQQP